MRWLRRISAVRNLSLMEVTFMRAKLFTTRPGQLCAGTVTCDPEAAGQPEHGAATGLAGTTAAAACPARTGRAKAAECTQFNRSTEHRSHWSGWEAGRRESDPATGDAYAFHATAVRHGGGGKGDDRGRSSIQAGGYGDCSSQTAPGTVIPDQTGVDRRRRHRVGNGVWTEQELTAKAPECGPIKAAG
jgi:hypothetical protein